MMQDEPIAVFEHTHPQPQLDRNSRLPFADPFGVGLKNGEYFLFMGNDLPLNDPPADLIDLADGMNDIAVEVANGYPEDPGQLGQEETRGASPSQEAFCLVKITLVGLLDGRFMGMTLLLILRGGVFQVLDESILFFERPDIVTALPPVGTRRQ